MIGDFKSKPLVVPHAILILYQQPSILLKMAQFFNKIWVASKVFPKLIIIGEEIWNPENNCYCSYQQNNIFIIIIVIIRFANQTKMDWLEQNLKKLKQKKKCHNWQGKPLLWPITVGPNKTKDDVLLGLHAFLDQRTIYCSLNCYNSHGILLHRCQKSWGF